MSLDPLIRRLSLIAGVFALLGTIIGVVAISTNFWTWHSTNIINKDLFPTTFNNGTMIMEDKWDFAWNVTTTKIIQEIEINPLPFV